MKNISVSIFKYCTLALLSIGIFTSCDDETNFSPYKTTVSLKDAKVKFLNTAIGPDGTNFTVNWFLDDTKSTAVFNATSVPLGISFGSNFPASINYALTPAGKKNMQIKVPADATNPESTVVNSQIEFEAEKNYSSFLVGTNLNYSTYTINDDLTISKPEIDKAYIRYVNVIPNSPSTGFDVSIKEVNENALIFTGVKYLEGDVNFIPVTAISDDESILYEVQLRNVGSTEILSKTTITLRRGRIYTFYSYGLVGGLSKGVPSTTVNIPKISYYTNK